MLTAPRAFCGRFYISSKLNNQGRDLIIKRPPKSFFCPPPTGSPFVHTSPVQPPTALPDKNIRPIRATPPAIAPYLTSIHRTTAKQAMLYSINRPGKESHARGTSISEPVEVFYSYAHKDEELRNELDIHLATLKREKVIRGWHDRGIVAGRNGGEIDEHLKSADIILLWSARTSRLRLLQRHRSRASDEATRGDEPASSPSFCAPPTGRAPASGKLQPCQKCETLTRWEDRDEAFLNVAEGIPQAVEELLATHGPRLKPADDPRLFLHP